MDYSGDCLMGNHIMTLYGRKNLCVRYIVMAFLLPGGPDVEIPRFDGSCATKYYIVHHSLPCGARA